MSHRMKHESMGRFWKQAIICLTLIVSSVAAFGQASLLPLPKQQFFDSNGNPLSSGTVENLVPNTSTRKTTWTNAGATSQNANPVVLDAAGRATIYGTGSYRQIIKNAAGVTQIDAVTAAPGSSTSNTIYTDVQPVGTILPFAGLVVPTNYLFADGSAISRTTFATLKSAITSTQNGTTISGTANVGGLTVPSQTTQFKVGTPMEGTCFPPGTTIASIASSVAITASANATSSGTCSITFFPFGNGNGTTTFNLPDMNGRVPAGIDGTGSTLTNTFCVAAGAIGLGSACGTQFKTIAQANLPNVTLATTVAAGQGSHGHTLGAAVVLQAGAASVTPSASGVFGFNNTGTTTVPANTLPAMSGTTPLGGSATALSAVQPTIVVNYIIKYQTSAGETSGVISLGGLFGDITCGGGVTCIDNVISFTGVGSGDVNGPGSSIDNHLTLFNGATGKLLKQGSTVDGNYVWSGAQTISSSGTNLTLSGNSQPQFCLSPSSGATKIGCFSQLANNIFVTDSGVANRTQIDLATGNVTLLTGSLTLNSGGITSPGFILDVSGNLNSNSLNSSLWIATATVAPATPSAGVGYVWIDSTTKRLSSKNDAGVTSVTVVPDTGASNNFVTAISAAGVISKAQPSVNNLSGFGTGVATALGTNIGSAGAFVTFNGAGGTPSSLVLTNATGLPVASLVGTVSVANGGTNASTAATALTNLGALPLAGGTMTGLLTLSGDPSTNLQAATKQYVDATVVGLQVKPNARLATITAGTLASSFENGDTVDGIVLATNDIILIKDQAAPAENGVYTVNASGAPTRITQLDTWSEAVGAFTLVLNGTAANQQWVTSVASGGTINVTAMPWVQFGATTTYSAGNGLSLGGTTFSVNQALSIESLALGTGGAATTPNVTINGGTNSGVGPYVLFKRGGTTIGAIGSDSQLEGGTSSDLSLFTFNAFRIYGGASGGTEMARFTNGGNFGIGTATPAFPLDVVGTGRATTFTETMAAVTLKGNPTSGSAASQSFTIAGLTARTAPLANSDQILIWDSVAGTLKKVTPAANYTASTGVYNVLSYGALGDSNGTHLNGTDNTAFIQAALTASANGTMYLPCGTYRITDAISAVYAADPAPAVAYNVIGEPGHCVSIYLDASTAKTAFKFISGVTQCPKFPCVTIENVHFITPNTQAGSIAVEATKVAGFYFINNVVSAYGKGIALVDTYAPTFFRNTFTAILNQAVQCSSDASCNGMRYIANTLTGSGLTGSVGGLEIGTGSGTNCGAAPNAMQITGNDFESSYIGIVFQGACAANVSANYFEGNSAAPFYFGSGYNSGFTITDNWINLNGTAGSGSNKTFATGNVTGVTFTNNSLRLQEMTFNTVSAWTYGYNTLDATSVLPRYCAPTANCSYGPNGYITQWGQVTTVAFVATATFPIACSTTPASAITTAYEVGSLANVTSLSTSAMGLQSTAGSATVGWQIQCK